MNTKVIERHATSEKTAKQKYTQLIVGGRGEAKLCFRISDVSEVGQTVNISPLDGPVKAFVGSMILHRVPVPVIDVAFAIGAVRELSTSPPMFIASRTKDVVCIAIDEIVGIHKCLDAAGPEQPHELVSALVTVDGQSLPLIDVSAVSILARAMAKVSSHNESVNKQRDSE
jgi:chemotaxis signal transduction protein